MAITLSSLMTELPGIGPSRAKAFARLGILHVRDLLFHFPRKYEDFSTVTPIKDLELGKQMTIEGSVVSIQEKAGFYGKRRLLRIYADIDDGTGNVHVVWFNLRFLKNKLPIGTVVYLAGKVEDSSFSRALSQKDKKPHFTMRSPSLEFPEKGNQRIHTAVITPTYDETAGISSRFIRYQIKSLQEATKLIPEYLPEDVRVRNGLVGIAQAVQEAHFPQSGEQLTQARKRLQFDELFFLQLAALVRKKHFQTARAHEIPANKKELDAYIKEMPFQLTNAQLSALKDIMEDMSHKHPMNRLLQGDVGSGKSAVALIATQMTLNVGMKVLYLAPTEILARQQAMSFQKQLGSSRVHLLIGALKKQEKEYIRSYMVGDEPCCIIGTHALLQETIQATDVGLVIIDEQHRFGVAQRKALLSVEDDIVPHLLSMTATPIPRTLTLTVYGDLEVSVLDELPPGRQPIQTYVIDPQEKDEAIIHMLSELHAGRQAYIITPIIEDSKVRQVKSLRGAYDEIRKLFPGIAVGILHGGMSSEEKEGAMNSFAQGAIQLLVATAVVEVGVNVPNATIMMIEGAQRFGLAQLHQFRGRIGRGEHASTCYVVPSESEDVTKERLALFARTTDGFEIAEADLRFRGPGEIYGREQSGFGNLRVASLLDYEMISLARREAQSILDKDPFLDTYPILKKKVQQKNALAHFE